jgi:hypothetical protein
VISSGPMLAPVNARPAPTAELAEIFVGKTVAEPLVVLVEVPDTVAELDVDDVLVDVGETLVEVGDPLVEVDEVDVEVGEMDDVELVPVPEPPAAGTRTVSDTDPTEVPSTVTSAELVYRGSVGSVMSTEYRTRMIWSARIGPAASVKDEAEQVCVMILLAGSVVTWPGMPLASRFEPS